MGMRSACAQLPWFPRQEIHCSTLNDHWARQEAILYFTPALRTTVESLVTDVRYTILIHFPVIAEHSKGTHYFHRVVGLVVNICHCLRTYMYLLVHCKVQSLVPSGECFFIMTTFLQMIFAANMQCHTCKQFLCQWE